MNNTKPLCTLHKSAMRIANNVDPREGKLMHSRTDFKNLKYVHVQTDFCLRFCRSCFCKDWMVVITEGYIFFKTYIITVDVYFIHGHLRYLFIVSGESERFAPF